MSIVSVKTTKTFTLQLNEKQAALIVALFGEFTHNNTTSPIYKELSDLVDNQKVVEFQKEINRLVPDSQFVDFKSELLK